MTSTQIITSQSIGTSSNKGDDLFAQRLTPQAITDRFFVEGRITNGAGTYDVANKPRLWYATYNASITASLAPAILRKSARYLDLTPFPNGGQVMAKTSVCEPLGGPYIYLWCDIPGVSVAQSLDVWIHEGP